jgi:hypothetical protein
VDIMKPKKLVCGVAVNDADYVVVKHETTEVNGVQKRKQVWNCKYYQTWTSMLKRCCDAKLQERYPSYKGCTVSEDWLVFSKFKAWMKKQDFEGNHLDKDLLVDGNKVYGPDTCVFIAPLVNTFIIDRGAARGEWLLGASWHKPTEKFIARCRNPFTRKQEHLGLFKTEQEAHNAWAKRKLELARELASIQTDPRVAKALINRYSKL